MQISEKTKISDKVIALSRWSNLKQWIEEHSFLGMPMKIWLRVILIAPFAYLAYILILITLYTFINPVSSAFMIDRQLSGRNVSHKWVPIERISRHMPVAVITSEDNRFCSHYGVDWRAIWRILRSRNRKLRGASTITMQTVKNLFLWSHKDYLRKALEIPLSYTASTFWSKRRLMEIYLNIAEFAPGVYGVEAASRYHFRKSASRLTLHEASLLAAVLPNPDGRIAGRPGPKTRGISSLIVRRMRAGRKFSHCIWQ